jgi:putative transposase
MTSDAVDQYKSDKSDEGRQRPPDPAAAAAMGAEARQRGLELTGPDGLLKLFTKNVLETALNEEITGHLGYEKNQAGPGRQSANVRNGARAKTVISDAVGEVRIDVPRDREGTFEPQIVKKRQRRLTEVDEIVLSLYAKGLTTGEISAHFAEIYGAAVSRETVSRITEKVVAEMQEWATRPLDAVYVAIFIDAIVIKVRDGQVANRPVYAAIGVTTDGRKDVLGLQSGTGGEGARFWMSVLTDLKNRGVRDVFFLVCDGLKGLPEAVGSVWPLAIVQTCIIHRSRQEIRCCLSGSGTMGCYADTGRCRRSACPEIRGLTASSGRASAAVGAGDRGPAARAWRGAPGRAARRGQRDHRPQGRIRTRRRCRAVIRGAGAAPGWRPDAGRGR